MDWHLIAEALSKAVNDLLLAGLAVTFPYVVYWTRAK